MKRLKASVFKLGKNLNCAKVGEIIWNGKEIVVEPSGVRELKNIAGRSYWIETSRGPKKISPDKNPRTWIENLHKRYSSERLRVSKAS